MRAANQPTAHGETTSARRFEGDYVGRTGAFRGGSSPSLWEPVISSEVPAPLMPPQRRPGVEGRCYFPESGLRPPQTPPATKVRSRGPLLRCASPWETTTWPSRNEGSESRPVAAVVKNEPDTVSAPCFNEGPESRAVAANYQRDSNLSIRPQRSSGAEARRRRGGRSGTCTRPVVATKVRSRGPLQQAENARPVAFFPLQRRSGVEGRCNFAHGSKPLFE